VQITYTRRGDSLPVSLSAGREFFNRIARLVARAQSDRVEQQRTVDGGPLKRNSAKTRAIKARRGQPQLSLIDGWRMGGVKWTSAGRSGGKTGQAVAYSTSTEVSREKAWRRNVTASFGYKWRSAGRSGGRIRTMEETFIHTVKGKQTREHHFIGMDSTRRAVSDRSAVVWLPYDSSKIASDLEKLGYTRWWGFDAKTIATIDATWRQTLRDKIRQAAKRKVSRG